jgi:hypothetical protein
MAKSMSKKFKWRAFISVTTGVSFLAMSISGLILYVTPTGRVAHWIGWRMLAMTKDQWGGLHILFGLIFLIAASVHTYLNWKVFVSYFRDNVRHVYSFKREWVLTMLLMGLVCVGTLAELPPFSTVLALNEFIKDSWEIPGQQAPIPHAELMTVQEIATKIDGANVETMMANLRAAGVTVDSANAVLLDLAENHNQTPREMYTLAVGEELARSSSANAGLSGSCRSGRGTGQLTLREYCQRRELDLTEATRQLEAHGYQPKPDMKLRDIAHAAEAHVTDIEALLLKQ